MFLWVAAYIKRIINITITLIAMGIHKGEKIHHHDQVIILLIFNVRNIKNSTVKNDIPLPFIF